MALDTAIALTEQQQQAVQAIQAFLVNPDQKLFLLAGYPGTGKSTTIVQLIQELIVNHQQKVVLTAPTNKATSVLKRMASEQTLRIECMTIHQLLGLSVVNRGDKQLERTSPSHLERFDLAVIDECSMINQGLWHWIQQAIEQTWMQTKILLMGDPAQLNPVNEGRSPSFSIPNRMTLTQVVRQGADNPLITVLKQCRSAIKQQTPFHPVQQSTQVRENGMVLVRPTALLNYACKRVRHFEVNPNQFRILCWTNRRVDHYNAILRQHLYGKDAPRFVPNERMITLASAIAPNGKTIALPTSIEFTITKIEERSHEGYRAWCLTVLPEGYDSQRQIYVLHEDEQARFEHEVERSLQNAKQNPYLWRKYYRHLEIFAQIRPCFALTVHNAQGSTFEEVGLDGVDLQKRLDGTKAGIREYNRLFYVGASRAKRRVLVTKS
ncbi:MAG: AAA family ATPase [Leptolyngbya sp. UWPOB_LEPTO1]|uniref:ATP-dependent DNA helicase n=1 Tax=Leptolyngbya sp. UWPOB_LEPTO1 TaxID=2815653 RepID=UPI001AC5D5BE|nr:DEAD/DEAH box helicase [Leptolyngbya sp. UWPOB_LEPTO1]MBN8564795.1 AAA family ATPase [Leptolyngbya sp. UWPOB_LEPTO1]